MDLAHPFALVTPTADGDALAVLAGAEKGFTASEVRSLAGRRSVEGMRRALKRLETQGIVTATKAGNATIYTLNRAHIGAAPVLAFASIRSELIDRIRAHLETWTRPCTYAAMFGSAARGTMHPASDIDLLVIRPPDVDPDAEAWVSQLSAVRNSVREWTGNDARVLELDGEEAAIQAAKPRSVLADARRDGIWLAGRRTYLAEILDGLTR